MRKPPQPEGKVWIRAQPAVAYLDLANALYVHMLRMLIQAYVIPGRTSALRRALVSSSTRLMRAMTPVGTRLTQLAADADGACNAGMSLRLLKRASAKVVLPCNPQNCQHF